MNSHEEEQCRKVAATVKTGAKTGLIVDDDAKAGRFIAKIRELCPEAMVIARMPFFANRPNGPVLVSLQIPNARGNN